jgi:hypothetical protein
MDNIFIKLHDGADEPEKKWTNGIHKFLTDSGAIVTPETVEELGKQALKDLQPKIDSDQLTEPEFTMALLEVVMPLCPTLASKASIATRSTLSSISSVLRAMQSLAEDARAGVPLEKLRISAINLNQIIKKAKIKLPQSVASLKAEAAKSEELKVKANELLKKFESNELGAEHGQMKGQVDERFSSLADIVEARKLMAAVTSEDQDQEIGEEEDIEEGGEAKQSGIMFRGERISKRAITRSYEAERSARQLLAFQYYSTKVEISIVKSSVVAVIKTATLFDRMPTIQIERGTETPGAHDVLESFIKNNIPVIAEKSSEATEQLTRSHNALKALHAFKSYTQDEMVAKNLPMAKLIEMLPESDYSKGDFAKLIDLEEIYQHKDQTKAAQRAKPGMDLNANKITYDMFAKSFPGADLSKTLTPEQKEKFEETFNKISEQPMTWRKGMTIALLSDPPSPTWVSVLEHPTVESGQFGQNKLVGRDVELGKGEVGMGDTGSPDQVKKLQQERAALITKIKDTTKNRKNALDPNKRKKGINPEKIKEYDDNLATWTARRQAIEEELKTLGVSGKAKQLASGAETYERSGARLGRKLFELNRDNPHWVTFYSSVRPAYINRDTLAADAGPTLEIADEVANIANSSIARAKDQKGKKQLRNFSNKVRSSVKDLAGQAGIMPMNSKSIVVSAIENDRTPSWILMRAVQYPFDKQTSDLAEYNLEQRGWSTKLDEKGNAEEDNNGDIMWARAKEKKPAAPKAKAPVKAPAKAPEKKPVTKSKKSSALSFRERSAATDPASMAANNAALEAKKQALQKEKLALDAQKNADQKAQLAPPAATPTAPTSGQPSGVNTALGSVKSRLSKRG